MGRQAPSFQLYPGDWFREPGLKVVDLNVRGAWAELLMVMWDKSPQGQIETHIDGLAKLWRVSPEEACFIVDELDKNDIADVKYFNDECKSKVHNISGFYQGLIGDVSSNVPSNPGNVPRMSPYKYIFITIINRRMLKVWNDKEKERLKKQRQRNKGEKGQYCPGDVPKKSTPPSSSSSSLEDDKSSSRRTKEKFPDDSQPATLSILLLDLIRERNPNHKPPDIKKWALHIDRMIRIDKRPPTEIDHVIRWCQADNFWQDNILSTKKLRDQYDQLVLKMRKARNVGARDPTPRTYTQCQDAEMRDRAAGIIERRLKNDSGNTEGRTGNVINLLSEP